MQLFFSYFQNWLVLIACLSFLVSPKSNAQTCLQVIDQLESRLFDEPHNQLLRSKLKQTLLRCSADQAKYAPVPASRSNDMVKQKIWLGVGYEHNPARSSEVSNFWLGLNNERVLVRNDQRPYGTQFEHIKYKRYSAGGTALDLDLRHDQHGVRDTDASLLFQQRLIRTEQVNVDGHLQLTNFFNVTSARFALIGQHKLTRKQALQAIAGLIIYPQIPHYDQQIMGLGWQAQLSRGCEIYSTFSLSLPKSATWPGGKLSTLTIGLNAEHRINNVSFYISTLISAKRDENPWSPALSAKVRTQLQSMVDLKVFPSWRAGNAKPYLNLKFCYNKSNVNIFEYKQHIVEIGLRKSW